ncbi:DHH family phosphoesterase [Ruminococcaceae bacterium OttesenSCG-928-O06]|nr:DHH family phosphoesterase [Ruminococcaceae bacterium OttesenSCG-928-O06]
MNNRKHFWSADTLVILLSAACLGLAVLLAIARPAWLGIAVAIVAVVALLAFAFLQHTRAGLRRLVGGKAGSQAAVGALGTFSLPVAALHGKELIWYNDAFARQIAKGAECTLVPIGRLVPGLEPTEAAAAAGQDIRIDDTLYTVYGNRMLADSETYFMVFVENTLLKHQAGEYQASRPGVLYFAIDTYEEILQQMRESERAIIVSNIDVALERAIAKSSGFLRRVSASRYMAVVEERHLQQMMDARFPVLDEVRALGQEGGTVTLSIGVGHQCENLHQCEESAQQALEMALGRGGDQAAVKGTEGYEFYGGVTRSVEKRTKVKSRIVAGSIHRVMDRFDKVLVMGHRDSDMDCVGAAVGMLRFARLCKKPAAIVIDRERTLAPAMIAHLEKNGYGDDMIDVEEGLSLTGAHTLLVVVDTHMPHLLESEEIYHSCGGVVVIDHHRKMVGHIDNSLVFYHEPYASSASELVSELLMYVADDKDDKPTAVEAESLLAGIMLDTRTFSLHVGVRTFEAAAWLRRMGARTEEAKKLFATTMDEYLYKSHLVAEAKVHAGCAVAISDKVPTECEVAAPQAANELLSIEGVKASFVGVLQGGTARLSARSMGEVNVQLIMEKVGGGGHLTMAGAQIPNATIEETYTILYNAIEEYMEERTHS